MALLGDWSGSSDNGNGGHAGAATWFELSAKNQKGVSPSSLPTNVIEAIDVMQEDGVSSFTFRVPYLPADGDCGGTSVAVCEGKTRSLILAYGSGQIIKEHEKFASIKVDIEGGTVTNAASIHTALI